MTRCYLVDAAVDFPTFCCGLEKSCSMQTEVDLSHKAEKKQVSISSSLVPRKSGSYLIFAT